MSTTGFSFFDGVVNSPGEELALVGSRMNSNHYDSALSLQGRAGCLLRVVSHSACIPLKPLYYFGYYGLAQMSICVMPSMRQALDAPEFAEYNEKNREEAAAIRVLADNPELLHRYEREVRLLPLCAVVAPISQTMQVLKAVGGVLYPALYYQHDPFIAIFASLSSTARSVGCSEELVDCLEMGSSLLHEKLFYLSNRDYYMATFLRDFGFINEKMQTPDLLPKERKLVLLNMLDPLSSKSGMKGCAPAIGRILEQIVAQIDIPEDPERAIPHLCDQFKEEVINRLVMQTELALDKSRLPWQNVMHSTAHDPSHRGNAFIVAMGDQIGMSMEIINRAKQDSMANRSSPLEAKHKELLLDAFYELYTKSELTKSLLEQLNSKQDGTPGLKAIRAAIFQRLCENLQATNEAEDMSMEAVRRFYLHAGEGSPSENNFTDLNDHALYSYTATLIEDPFTVFTAKRA